MKQHGDDARERHDYRQILNEADTVVHRPRILTKSNLENTIVTQPGGKPTWRRRRRQKRVADDLDPS